MGCSPKPWATLSAPAGAKAQEEALQMQPINLQARVGVHAKSTNASDPCFGTCKEICSLLASPLQQLVLLSQRRLIC